MDLFRIIGNYQSWNNKTILLNDDIDPDVNVVNQLSSSSPCNYYLPSEIADWIKSMHISNELYFFVHINARSMVIKLVYIELLLKPITNDFDILAVSETWKNYLYSNLINIPG